MVVMWRFGVWARGTCDNRICGGLDTFLSVGHA